MDSLKDVLQCVLLYEEANENFNLAGYTLFFSTDQKNLPFSIAQIRTVGYADIIQLSPCLSYNLSVFSIECNFYICPVIFICCTYASALSFIWPQAPPISP